MIFTNSKEDLALKDIFKDTISIYTYKDTKAYQIFFKNKYYEFIIDKDYPTTPPISSIKLGEDVFKKYKKNINIFSFFYECIKKEELNLDKSDEYTSIIEYDTIDKITEQQFQDYKLKHPTVHVQREGLSGKEIFLQDKIRKNV
ncbi:hypothetical protein AAJ76_3800018357 [Vairimorpha ceranae]|uniref:Uncharacterized protein n=1 Tax=Vairimorpha ceranae TaxID=40302 RepID=A0A0F9WPR5_9MICR|nr:hypothetical protein AAJ76_3800018357 [Vairimorpha ceranae]KAF5140271.1 hypothetical protein G9O61_00g015270 [Vairimorpha ceranae]KKO74938.1 hypothetical protein AAJ76_3800018357 [Vairimorpha ceranae]